MPIPDYPRPPFKPQQQPFPGKSARTDPVPDIGKDSYVGHGLLEGKRALITGGDSGIGAAVAIAFAREGASVAIAHLPEEQDDAVDILAQIKAAGVQGHSFPCDLRDPAQIQTLAAGVLEAFGGLDVLVNNAAYQRYFQSFEEITLDEWTRTFATNVHAPFYLIKQLVPHLQPGASIINTASVNAKDPTPNILPYSTTKGAVANMTLGLASLLAERGIRVNAVLPGPIWTPFIPAGMAEEKVKTFGSQTPFGRPGQPAELASAYVMLATDTASYTSGALITIAGAQAVL
ncbi:short-chain dehydrogenase/reductase SDR [Pseudoxanthomonas spadix BD-a59]|uniref:Short-chain dehydrogenase/reductase SDR n=1 Tax=Pseudoxanthomonas spadix (strain BD-a59) TaxID=1045855 RepID=G7UTY3_PSEUP|nr:SDR family oxidoreductase [Pseudoxanthomonas spadix]AER57417.1 short-chain dehydrogenase/reductase SDR [Pseudoxanthomonas spadix BD-a59]